METLTSTNNSVPAGPMQDLTWSAPIHPVHERSPRWYAGGAAVILVCAVYGFFTGAWSFSLVALLIGALYFLLREEPPVIKQISLGDRGFTFDGAFTSFEDCSTFWFIHTPTHTELHIVPKRRFAKETVIQIGGIHPTAIRAFLSPHLPEKSDRRERLMDVIIRLCKL